MAKVVKKIVNVVKKVVKKVVEVVKKVVKAVVNFVGDVIGAVVGGFIPTIGGTGPGGTGTTDMPSIDVPGTSTPEQEAIGVTLTKQGSNIPIPIIYGYRRVGGINIFLESNGTSNKYLYGVYVIGEGPIKGVKRIIVDDIEIPLPTEGDGIYTDQQVYTVSEGRFANRMKFQVFYGEAGQAQSSVANESNSWGNAQRLGTNIAYAAFRFEWTEIKTQEEADKNPFRGGMPMVKFDVLGRKVRDVRNIPAGGNPSSLSGTTYSFNPANIICDYMTNTLYGCGIPDSKIHGDSFRIAANKYEQTVTYSTGTTGRSHTLNIVASPAGANFETLKSLIANSRAAMPFSQGTYKLKVEDGGHPTDIQSSTVTSAFDVTKEHYIGNMELEGEKKDRKFNEVRLNYIDPDKEWSSQSVIYTEDGDLAEDNSEPLIGEFQYPGITNKHIAEDIARMIYKKSRVGRQIMFNATQELLNVDIGDIITVTNDILDLDGDTFRVMAMRLDPEGTVSIEASEHDAALYPYVTQPQIVLPAPLYKTDTILLEPFVRTPPEYPVGIFPPNDPDDPWSPGDVDSAGVEIDPPPNTILPPNPDLPEFTPATQSVRSFQRFTANGYADATWVRFHYSRETFPPGGFDETIGGIRTGSKGLGLLHDWRVNGDQPFTGNTVEGMIPTVAYVDTPIATFYPPSLPAVSIVQRDRGMDYARFIDNAVSIGGVRYPAMAFLPNKPEDTGFLYAKIRYYQNNQQIYEQIWDLREIGSKPARNYYGNINSFSPTTDVVYEGKEFLMPLIPNTQVTFRWHKDGVDYADGSDLVRSYSYYGDTFTGFPEWDTLDVVINGGPYEGSSLQFYDGGIIRRFNNVGFLYSYKLPNGVQTEARSNIEAVMNYYNDMASAGVPGETTETKTISQPLG